MAKKPEHLKLDFCSLEFINPILLRYTGFNMFFSRIVRYIMFNSFCNYSGINSYLTLVKTSPLGDKKRYHWEQFFLIIFFLVQNVWFLNNNWKREKTSFKKKKGLKTDEKQEKLNWNFVPSAIVKLCVDVQSRRAPQPTDKIQ